MDYLKEFTQYLQDRDRSPVTVRGYLMDLKQVERWLCVRNGRTLLQITSEEIKGFRQQLLDGGAKPSTINRRMASLAAFGHWAVERGLLEQNPALYVETIDTVFLAPRWLDEAQRRKFLATVRNDLREARAKYPRLWLLRQRDATMALLLFYTGLRVSELCGLRLSDVTLSERKGVLVVRSGKGRKQRTVPLKVEMREMLSAWLQVRPQVESDGLFIGQRGEAVTVRIIQRIITRYAEDAELDEVTPHSLRHTFARSLLESGSSLVEVAALLGHKSLNATARYTQPGENDLALAVERVR